MLVMDLYVSIGSVKHLCKWVRVPVMNIKDKSTEYKKRKKLKTVGKEFPYNFAYSFCEYTSGIYSHMSLLQDKS